MKRCTVLMVLWSVFSCPAKSPPNLVVIMTDNHGAWTLGCYGNKDIHTPHLDRMASEGARFTRAFANNAVCSPTRATFLTGLMPSQHGVHRYLGAGRAQIGPKAFNTIEEFDSLPQILSEAGYVCGLSGKWHLGKNMEPQDGFTFWVTKPHGHSKGFYDQDVIENGKIRKEPSYLTEYWTRRGLEFIERNQEKSFFLFLAYNGPYWLGNCMLEKVPDRYVARYGDHPLPSFPRRDIHPWLHQHKQLINNPKAIRNGAGQVTAVDAGVGEILGALKKWGLDENTLVVFTADQGAAGGHGGFWGMGDHTRPLTAFDWTMHIPLIFRQPGRIPAGVTSERLVANYDMFPTILALMGLADRIPTKPVSPGRPFTAQVMGQTQEWDDVVFYEFENVRAVRTAEWKYVERFNQKPNELYFLPKDPEEQRNLIDVSAHTEKRMALKKKLDAFFEVYTVPAFDLWKGGRSKTGLMTGRLFD